MAILAFLTFLLLHYSAAAPHHHHRRLLHHPFSPLSPSSSPQPQPRPQKSLPKHPFSSSPTPNTTADTGAGGGSGVGGGNSFFPTYRAPPPPPPPQATTALPTFPANISSLALPTSSRSTHSNGALPSKLIVVLVFLSLLVIFLIVSLAALLRRHRRREEPPPPDTPTSDGHPPKLRSDRPAVENTGSEFLYLGTLANSREFEGPNEDLPRSKLGSPELKPLPPLPTNQNSDQNCVSSEEGLICSGEEEEFFSPRGSSSEKLRFHGEEIHETFGGKSLNSSCPVSNSSSPSCYMLSSPSPPFNFASRSFQYNPPANPTQSPPEVIPSNTHDCSHREWAGKGENMGNSEGVFGSPPATIPAPPPPPPVPGNGPPPLVPPSGAVVFQRSASVGGGEGRRNGETKEEEGVKPKLKALHWDKLRASSDRVMVWDQLKPASFQLNEEMIETLFKANGPNSSAKEGARKSIMPLLNDETRVLDPKKYQNVSILLKALNVTIDEVCEALLEGNADTLGTELLESLIKMAPTKEEEWKLKEYKDESPLKLGPAEKFLKAVLDIPFAFKRVDVLLYIANFDSELEYLRKSFETLEAACEELKNSRMFLKLLEAVLKTGNRMNVGTNRGDAQAFKLDTLLKLVDIKGTDGKTTLLHFVVQEIIKCEASPNNPQEDIDTKKRGLHIVSGLGGELSNVKKAASMDANALSRDLSNIVQGMSKVGEVIRLNEEMGSKGNETRFAESMIGFLNKTEANVRTIEAQETRAFTKVRELTGYFHGNSAMEEAHPLRIFVVVRDFLGVLDRVCKEVAKMNERTVIRSARPSSGSVNLPPDPFPELGGNERDGLFE